MKTIIQTLLLTVAILSLGVSTERDVQAQQLGVPEEVENIGIDEHLERQIPLDLEFYDELGRKYPLSEYFRGVKPVLISFNYSDCPKLCDAQLTGLVRTFQDIGLKPGKDFEYISISIDPEEKPTQARRARDKYVERYGDLSTKEGWHFLTGDRAAVKQITNVAGFRYTFLRDRNEFAHAPVLVLCTADGKIARYLYGIEVEPSTMELSIVEVGDGKIGGSMQQIILWCFNYDPGANSYVPQALNIMKLGGVATVIFIAAICIPFWFTRSRAKRNEKSDSAKGMGDDVGHASPESTNMADESGATHA